MRLYLTVVLLAATAVRGNDNTTTTTTTTTTAPTTTPPSVITFPPRTTLPPAVVAWPTPVAPSSTVLPVETPPSPAASPDSDEAVPTIVIVTTKRPSKQNRPNATASSSSSSSSTSGGQTHKTLYVLLSFGLAVFVLGMLFVLICSLYKKKMKILRLRALQHASNSHPEASDVTEFGPMPSPRGKRVSFEDRSTLSSEPRSSLNQGSRLPALSAGSVNHHHL